MNSPHPPAAPAVEPCLSYETRLEHLRAKKEAQTQEKLRKLGITPSGPADDATYLRRVHLDVIGVLPKFAIPMREAGDRFQNMYFAAKGGNWGLAFYMSKYMNGAMSPAKVTKPN